MTTLSYARVMSNRWWALGLVASLASAACSNASEEEESFDYGRDEMRSAIEGTWEGTSRRADGSAGPTMTLKLVYSTADTRPLCSNRLLSEQGTISPQCMSMSSINVTGTITAPVDANAAPSDLALRGTFDVPSLRFDGRGLLHAEVDGRKIDATLSNEVLDGNLTATDGSIELSFSAQRRK